MSLVIVWWISSLIGHSLLTRPGAPSGERAVAILVTASLWVAVIVGFGAVVYQEKDELIRRLHLEAAAFAFFVAAILITIFQALAQFGIHRFIADDAAALVYLPWAGALVFLGWRYRFFGPPLPSEREPHIPGGLG
ncbi:MAG: hypothetical protein ACRD1L_13760 [Terriglobales bacterium]